MNRPNLKVRPSSRTVDGFLWALAAAILFVTVIWSLGPAPPTGRFSFGDKAEHAAAYAGLICALLLVAVWRPGKLRGDNLAWKAVLVCLSVVAIGIALELGQAVTGRDADWRDVLADAAGVLAGVLLWRLWYRGARELTARSGSS